MLTTRKTATKMESPSIQPYESQGSLADFSPSFQMPMSKETMAANRRIRMIGSSNCSKMSSHRDLVFITFGRLVPYLQLNTFVYARTRSAFSCFPS
jgi:hypothetical protein